MSIVIREQYYDRPVRAVALFCSGKMTYDTETKNGGDVQLKNKIKEMIEAGNKNIVLSIGDIEYIDSAGLGALISSYTTIKRKAGNLALCDLTKRTQDLFGICKITFFPVFDSVEEAVE